MKNIPLNERIILALDVENAAKAKQLTLKVEEKIKYFKVGLELFLAEGFALVEWLASRGHKVMLDLKLHDIPVTVSRAVARLSGHGVSLATVYGESAVIEAAAKAQSDVGILAVTVLTSLAQIDLDESGFTRGIEDLVLDRSRRAVGAGLAGIVCSGHEAGRLRRELGPDFLILTPGIRPSGPRAAGDDQQRVMTPGEAIAAGASQVIIGRPIRDAADPLGLIEKMQEEIAGVLKRA